MTLPPRVLVIDDEAGVRRFMIRALGAGYEVHEACDGLEGLAQAQRLHPRLIILDLRLPEMDGLSVLARLKADPDTQAIPVVIASVRGETDLLLEAQQDGAADQLIKPFTVETLRDVVARHVLLEPPDTAAGPPQPVPLGERPPSRPLVLVIDDEEGIRKLMQRSLEPDYTVVLAGDGRDGVVQACALHPRLIFLDLRLPDMDGLSVLARLKAEPTTSAIPVVIVSVRGESNMLLEGQHSGAADYLIKPFRLEELRAMAARHLLMQS